jgi:hypothetical protein
MATLSVIIPVKDEQDNLRPLYQRLCEALEPFCSRPNRVSVAGG